MASKSELYHAAKEAYLSYIGDNERSELTLEEAKTLLRLIENLPALVDSQLPSNPCIDEAVKLVVDEMTRLFPKLHRTERMYKDLAEGDGDGYLPKPR